MKRSAIFGSTVLSAMMICGVAAAQDNAPTPPPTTGTTTATPATAVPVQEEPTNVVAPPPAAQPYSAQATMTGQAATTSTVSTTQTTSAEELVYVKKEKSCGLIDHSCDHMHLEIALDGGASGFVENSPFGFNNSIGHVTSAGPAWGARVGAQFLPWLGADLHYIGMNNQVKSGEAASPGGGTALLTTGAAVEVRFIAPLPYVQPYAIVGLGVYHTAVTGDDAAKAGSQLYSGTSKGAPLGIGINVPISDGISAGGEAVYNRVFGESYSNNQDFPGGDITTFNAVVRAKL